MPELPSEPSVSTVKYVSQLFYYFSSFRKQLEQPVTDEQAKLLQEHLEVFAITFLLRFFLIFRTHLKQHKRNSYLIWKATHLFFRTPSQPIL